MEPGSAELSPSRSLFPAVAHCGLPAPFPTNPAASPSSLLEILPLRNQESCTELMGPVSSGIEAIPQHFFHVNNTENPFLGTRCIPPWALLHSEG